MAVPEERRGVGQPPKFESAEVLQTAIDAYFESCFEITVQKVGKGKKKKSVETRKQVKPYTMSGLALAIGVSRQTLVNYAAKDEYFDTIKKARQKCEAYLEEGMISGKLSTVGTIFNAKNNYGWKDKTEVDTNQNIRVTQYEDYDDAALDREIEHLHKQIQSEPGERPLGETETNEPESPEVR